MIAHVAGVPVEELLLVASASGAGAGLLLARARLMLRLRRQREPAPHRDAPWDRAPHGSPRRFSDVSAP